MTYAIAKWLHILSSTLLFGLGLGTAFHFFVISRGRDVRAIAAATRSMVLADWLFTTTTIVFQPVSGWYLMHLLGVTFAARWILWSLALYAIAGLCWLPVVWIQIRLRSLALRAARDDVALDVEFWRLRRIWIALGIPAFLALVAVFYLMVAKPA
jgi:uncharacterized membrane protein